MRVEPVDHRYAAALFGAALRRGELTQIGEDLAGIEKVHEGDASLFTFLESPQVLTEHKIEILTSVFRDRVRPISLEFLKLLIRKQRIDRLASIVRLFIEKVEEHQGILEADVLTAIPLDEERAGRLRKALERVTGKRIVLRSAVDPEILGGVVVSYGDTLLDGSVVRKLRDLREDLGKLRVH